MHSMSPDSLVNTGIISYQYEYYVGVIRDQSESQFMIQGFSWRGNVLIRTSEMELYLKKWGWFVDLIGLPRSFDRGVGVDEKLQPRGMKGCSCMRPGREVVPER